LFHMPHRRPEDASATARVVEIKCDTLESVSTKDKDEALQQRRRSTYDEFKQSKTAVGKYGLISFQSAQNSCFVFVPEQNTYGTGCPPASVFVHYTIADGASVVGVASPRLMDRTDDFYTLVEQTAFNMFFAVRFCNQVHAAFITAVSLKIWNTIQYPENEYPPVDTCLICSNLYLFARYSGRYHGC